MTDFVHDKKVITKKILFLIDENHSESDLERALFRWWKNPRVSGGLRLTDEGYTQFTQLGLEQWTFPITNKSAKSFNTILLSLDNKIRCPYFLKLSSKECHISLFDSRIASMIVLHSTLEDYLESTEKRNDNHYR
jgi:hypothetical protein